MSASLRKVHLVDADARAAFGLEQRAVRSFACRLEIDNNSLDHPAGRAFAKPNDGKASPIGNITNEYAYFRCADFDGANVLCPGHHETNSEVEGIEIEIGGVLSCEWPPPP